MPSRSLSGRVRGFTLVEAITVMLVVSVIALAVAVFIPAPVQGYLSTVRRLELADAADTALRRIGRDVRLALPNSVRVDASGLFLEFLPIKAGGRYRDNDSCFTGGCTSLQTLGDMLTNAQVATGSDQVSIYNTYSNVGSDCAPGTSGLYSAYCGHGVVTLASAAGAGSTSNTLGFASTVFLPPGGSPTRRVFVIAASPVTYACDAANGVLWRISGYARAAAQPTNLGGAPLSTASSRTRLATRVTCPAVVSGSVPPRFSYTAGASERYGLLSAWLTLEDSNESISLLHQIHVDNTP
jgi:MSHA biogenesis protein MshO